MTVQSAASSVTYNGNGATTVWNFAFEIDQASYAQVTLVDTTVSPPVTTVLQPTQYSITGLGNPGGGSVTYPLSGAPLVAGQYLTIQRVLPITQDTSFPNQGGFYPKTIEGALDYITMVAQQLDAKISRAIQVSVSDPGGVPAVLPPASERANQALLFDGQGNPVAGQPSGAPVSAPMIPVVAGATLPAARAAMGLGAVAVENIGTFLKDDGAGNLTLKIGTGLGSDGNDNLEAKMHGECRLSYGASNHITLAPYNGARLRINGVTYELPAAGVTAFNTGTYVSGVANSNLAASTCYLVYAMIVGGNIVLDFWPQAGGHMPDTTAGNIGVEVRNNGGAPDSTRTLVGMVFTTSTGQFQFSNSQIGVISWFNRREIALQAAGITASTSSTTLVPLNGVWNFLSWLDDAVDFVLNGYLSSSAIGTAAVALFFDGAQWGTGAVATSSTANYNLPFSCRFSSGVTEGWHSFVPYGDAQSGTTMTAHYDGQGFVKG